MIFFPVITALTLPVTKKKVLVLMSATGGGHLASAQAITGALDKLYPGMCETEILDIWTDYSPWPYRKFGPWYQFLAKRPMLWRALWFYAKFPVTRRLQEFCAKLSCYRSFRTAAEERRPDMIVSVHPLCQSLPLRVLKNMGGGQRQIPFVTVVTDLASAHPTWFHKDVDKCFVASDALHKLGRRCGVPESKLVQHGLPLREAFWQPESRSKADVRRDLGLPALPTALVVGGGDGVGRIAKIAKTCADECATLDQETSLVVVCGKNDDARNELINYAWPPNVRATIQGFVPNMDEYMAGADLIVTKAGPGTIAEAATRGLPVVVSSHLPGQEKGNVDFVRENDFGEFHRRPRRIAKTMKAWLTDPAKREQMSASAVAAASFDATTNIAGDIGKLLFGPEVEATKLALA